MSTSSGRDNKGIISHVSEDCCDTYSSDEKEDDSYMEDSENLDKCASSSSKDKVPLPKGFVESLMNREFVLPYSNKFPLPSAISCPGGCGEAYYCR